MEKDFEGWNQRKQVINKLPEGPFYHEREIWWCALGTNVGFEEDGTGINYDRPVLILKGFSRNMFFAVALTGRKKEGKFYFYLGEIDGREASAVLSQVRIIDTKRLVRKVGTLDEAVFKNVKQKISSVLFE